jgi:DNA-directed RNA polymerase specialized sigma24 family protein
MKREEWDTFVETRYTELVAAAIKVVGRNKAEDAVQAALLRAVETHNYLKCETNPFTWTMQTVKSVASTGRRGEDRAQEMRKDAAALLRPREHLPRGHRSAAKPNADDANPGSYRVPWPTR